MTPAIDAVAASPRRRIQAGQILVRLAPGEDPESTPSHSDVTAGAADAARHLDGGGPADRALRRHSSALQVSRVYHAARNVGARGRRHLGWSGLEAELGLSRTFRVQLNPDAPIRHVVEALREAGTVESATPNYLCQAPFAASAEAAVADDALASYDLIGHARALEMEPGDSALILAVIDSGVDLAHPEFAGRLRPGLDTVDLRGELLGEGLQLIGDARGRDRTPLDENGHGTACCGIVGARGVGVPPGLAGAARILPIRTLAAAMEVGAHKATAIGAIADIDEGFKAAIDLGARVLNLSFGTPESALRPGDPVPHVEMVRYALARDCVLVAASGNSGDAVRYFPACLPGVIAVGACDDRGRPARFSTRGAHVALSAPGVAIAAPARGGYQRVSGTSFAAPFVAATCALLLARAARRSAGLSSAEVAEALCASARPFSEAVDGCGVGVLDAPAAIAAIDRLLDDTQEAGDAA